MKKPIPIDRLAKAAMAKRSSLYTWMMENHDTFADLVAKAIRPNWEALSEEFGTNGLTDGNDKPPTASVTRHTWWRVRKAVKARRTAEAKRATTRVAAQPRPARPPAPTRPEDPPATDEPDEDDKPNFVFKPVTKR